MHPLNLAARFGPWVLVAGLTIGVSLPGLAAALRPWIPQMVAVLLLLATLRIEPKLIFGALKDLPQVAGLVLGLQLALPLLFLAIAYAAGVQDSPVALSLVLMASASSIIGSPNFCVMLGLNPAYAMRMMVVGTALLPLSVLPVFWLLPALGAPRDILVAVVRLLLTILFSVGMGMVLRKMLFSRPSPDTLAKLDGASAIFLAIFVIGLMPAVSAVFTNTPLIGLGWLAFAFAANFGLQVLVFFGLRGRIGADLAGPAGIIAGNRNIALFLVALPTHVTAPILIFIGCYQIPMYLTPLLLRRMYQRG